MRLPARFTASRPLRRRHAPARKRPNAFLVNRGTGGDRRIRVCPLRVARPVSGPRPIRCTWHRGARHLVRRVHLGPNSRFGHKNCHRRTTHQGNTERSRSRDAGHRGTSRHCRRECTDRGQPTQVARVRRPLQWRSLRWLVRVRVSLSSEFLSKMWADSSAVQAVIASR